MKTRITLLFFIFLFGSLFLVACGNTASADSSSGVPEQNPVATAEVSLEVELVVGTLKLSDTGQDITAAQASELLTLWKAYQVLSDSDTTAQFELDALIQQIEETMTSEQILAIDDMQITAESMFEFMQSAISQTAASTSSDPITDQAAGSPDGAGGVPMEGGTPPDGEMMGDLGMAGANAQTTSDTVDQRVSQMVSINPTLITALIQMLETKVQAGS